MTLIFMCILNSTGINAPRFAAALIRRGADPLHRPASFGSAKEEAPCSGVHIAPDFS